MREKMMQAIREIMAQERMEPWAPDFSAVYVLDGSTWRRALVCVDPDAITDDGGDTLTVSLTREGTVHYYWRGTIHWDNEVGRTLT